VKGRLDYTNMFIIFFVWLF